MSDNDIAMERREAQGSHAEGPRAPGPPPPSMHRVPDSWRETPASQAGEGSLASSLAPPGAPSPRKREKENGIRATRPPENKFAGRRSVGCLTSESEL